MKTIGLLGGMSWESTAVYYRMINDLTRARLGGLHSAPILLRSIDFAPLARLLHAEDWAAAGAMLTGEAASLARGGADCVLICSNTMHIVADPVRARLREWPAVRLIHVIDETAHALARDGRRRPLLLATRSTMEHGFYTDHLRAHGIEPVLPAADARAALHAMIFDELCQGVVRGQSREKLLAMIDTGATDGADSVILGCTELCLILDPGALALPGYDTTQIHAQAAMDYALG